MPSRRKRPAALNELDIKRFVEVATRMHKECVRHQIAVTSDHYSALMDLNLEICKAIRTITGKDPEWMRIPAHWEHPGVKTPPQID